MRHRASNISDGYRRHTPTERHEVGLAVELPARSAAGAKRRLHAALRRSRVPFAYLIDALGEMTVADGVARVEIALLLRTRSRTTAVRAGRAAEADLPHGSLVVRRWYNGVLDEFGTTVR